MPWADEDFGSGPLDKQQLVAALVDRGVTFIMCPDIFIFHLWHPDTHAGWPDAIRNHTLWMRRYHRLPHSYSLIGIGHTLPSRIPGAIKGALKAVMAPNIPHDRKVRVTVGPSQLSRDVFGKGFRVCVFFYPPHVYRNSRPVMTNDLSSAQPMIKDGDFVKLFGGVTESEASACVESASALCNLAQPHLSLMVLTNLLGVCIENTFLCDGELKQQVTLATEASDRMAFPRDYAFYDYLLLVSRAITDAR
jgi:hypothetical protein